MEIVVTRSNENTDELQHHGTKGMKWGQRLYQNKDGSLTALGKKRYNKEVEKLKAEEARVKAAEKAAKTKAKNQAKFDKLDEKKADLEARKKALKGKSDKDADDKPEETLDQKRERLMKSTDPKEIYKDRDALSYQELNDRVNRIDLENRLMSKIPAETQKTGKEYMDNARANIESATNLYKSVDNAVSGVANSYIGKTLAKNLGLDLPKEEKERESLSDFLKNANKKTDKEIQERAQTEANLKKLRDEDARQKKQAEKETAESANAEKTKKSDGATDEKADSAKTKKAEKADDEKADSAEKAKTDGKVYGEGTSKSTINEQMENGKKWWDTSGVADTVDYSHASSGESYVTAYLEQRDR